MRFVHGTVRGFGRLENPKVVLAADMTLPAYLFNFHCPSGVISFLGVAEPYNDVRNEFLWQANSVLATFYNKCQMAFFLSCSYKLRDT
jgi:hypothetical protein